MHHFLVSVITLVTTAVMTAQPKAAATDLAFMTGCWRFERNGRIVEEHWLAPAGGTLLGVSRTVNAGQTTEYEFVQIREQGDALVFIAKPSGQAEATFTLARHTSAEVVFENLAHDFPQQIRYRRVGADGLDARVEGTVKGQVRGIDFPYQRVECR